MILAGFSNGPSGTLSVSTLAPCTEASIRGTSFWVRVNTRWRLSVMTLENAASGYVARGEPQLALHGVSRFRHSSGENGPGVVHEHIEVWHNRQRLSQGGETYASPAWRAPQRATRRRPSCSSPPRSTRSVPCPSHSAQQQWPHTPCRLATRCSTWHPLRPASLSEQPLQLRAQRT